MNKTLDQIWGVPETKYKQKNLTDYKDFLKGMTKTDLQEHCRDIHSPFYEDRGFCFESLAKAFERHQAEKKVKNDLQIQYSK